LMHAVLIALLYITFSSCGVFFNMD
jgi:hypothetical protein